MPISGEFVPHPDEPKPSENKITIQLSQDEYEVLLLALGFASGAALNGGQKELGISFYRFGADLRSRAK